MAFGIVPRVTQGVTLCREGCRGTSKNKWWCCCWQVLMSTPHSQRLVNSWLIIIYVFCFIFPPVLPYSRISEHGPAWPVTVCTGSLLATAVKDVGGSSGLLIMQAAALLIIAGMEPWPTLAAGEWSSAASTVMVYKSAITSIFISIYGMWNPIYNHL